MDYRRAGIKFLVSSTRRTRQRDVRSAGTRCDFRQTMCFSCWFPSLERRAEAWLLRAPDNSGACAAQTLRGRGSEPQWEIIHGIEVESCSHIFHVCFWIKIGLFPVLQMNEHEAIFCSKGLIWMSRSQRNEITYSSCKLKWLQCEHGKK